MRLTVDETRCAGHGACLATCPEVFDLSDEGYAVVLVDEVPPDLQAPAGLAARQCPEGAIAVVP